MNIDAAEIELCLRKYQWAREDFLREVEDGYMFLRTLSHPHVRQFLGCVEQLPPSEQLELARLLVASSHLPALTLLGESLTKEDEARLNAYRAGIRSIVLPAISNSPATKTFAVKRADVAKTVLPVLSSAFGEKPQKLASLQWFYATPVGDWRFFMELDFGGTWGTEIRCYHRLVRNDSKSSGLMPMTLQSSVGPVHVPQVFSLLSLYGLPGDTCYIHSSEDVQDAMRSILVSRARLFRAVPGWVDQLSV